MINQAKLSEMTNRYRPVSKHLNLIEPEPQLEIPPELQAAIDKATKEREDRLELARFKLAMRRNDVEKTNGYFSKFFGVSVE